MLLLERMSTIYSDFPVSDQWMIKAIGVSMACFTIGLPILKNFLLKPLAIRLLPEAQKQSKMAEKKIPLKRKALLESQVHKFLNSGFKFVVYVIFNLYGWYAIQGQDWVFDNSQYHIPYPNGNIVPEKIVYYYALETGYYVFSTFAVFFEPKMKDRGQLFIHHLFTSFLLISSWFGRMTRFGVPIMLLHDIADPPMELAKLCLYSGYEMAANIFFGIFTLVFIIFRDWIYPKYIVWTAIKLTLQHYYVFALGTVISLSGLAVLHYIWTYMIFQVIKNSIIHGKTEDIREEE